MTTHVKSNGAETGIGKVVRNALPCSARLPATMGEQDRHCRWISGDFGGEGYAAGTLDAGCCCSHTKALYCKALYSKYVYSCLDGAMAVL